MAIAEMQPRKAQERYAQAFLTYLNDNVEPDEKGRLYFEGSLVNLLKDTIPQAQYSEVVGRILVPSGAITRVYNACWQINRRELYTDDVPHPSVSSAIDVRKLTKRVEELEQRLDDHVNRSIIHSKVE